jgi:hypothetical protein
VFLAVILDKSMKGRRSVPSSSSLSRVGVGQERDKRRRTSKCGKKKSVFSKSAAEQPSLPPSLSRGAKQSRSGIDEVISLTYAVSWECPSQLWSFIVFFTKRKYARCLLEIEREGGWGGVSTGVDVMSRLSSRKRREGCCA